MKLHECKCNYRHYFKDEQGNFQGEYKSWYGSGRQSLICHFRDGMYHGEYKRWDWSGTPFIHIFAINGEEVVDFLETPEFYPETPEEKTMFVLKYGSAPFIGDLSETA